MHKLLSIGLLICLCAWVQVARAQNAFSVDTTHVSANHPADAHVFYPWIVLTNNTPSALPMVCVKVQDQKPSAWETWLEDLDSAYTYVPDTSRFVLPTDTTLANYLIVSFHPNDLPGRASVVLKVYPEADPTDSVLLTFDGNAYRPVTAIDEVGAWGSGVWLYPQPAQREVSITVGSKPIMDIQILNHSGQWIEVPYTVYPENIILQTDALNPGLYFVRLHGANGNQQSLRLIIH